ncbi:MAG: hypothetical protein OQJ76_06240, partial [Rhodospirillales bacterium]|nr:hypothetical protein [Rhodospirillales bacterium]
MFGLVLNVSGVQAQTSTQQYRAPSTVIQSAPSTPSVVKTPTLPTYGTPGIATQARPATQATQAQQYIQPGTRTPTINQPPTIVIPSDTPTVVRPPTTTTPTYTPPTIVKPAPTAPGTVTGMPAMPGGAMPNPGTTTGTVVKPPMTAPSSPATVTGTPTINQPPTIAVPGGTKSTPTPPPPSTATSEPTPPPIATDKPEEAPPEKPASAEEPPPEEAPSQPASVDDAAERARKEAEARAKHEAAKAAREGSKARAKSGMGYGDVQPIDGLGGPSVVSDPGVSMDTINLLGALVKKQQEGRPGIASGDGGQCFGDLCKGAAGKAKKKAEEELEKQKKKAKEAAEEEAEKKKKKIKDKKDKAKKAKDKRDKKKKRSKESKAKEDLEDKLKEQGEKLNEEGEELDKRGTKLKGDREMREEEERRLRKEEGDLRKNDPNCRSAECKAKQAERAKNSRAINDLSKAEGRLQADMAKFQWQVQDYQRDADRLEKMKDRGIGMTKDEFRSHQADKIDQAARQQVGQLEQDLQKLKDQQLELREKGGSGSKQDAAIQREIDRLNGNLDQARDMASKAGEQAVKAKAYELGLKEEYDNYAKAKTQIGGQIAVQEAANKLAEQELKISDARKAGASKAELDAMNEQAKGLEAKLNEAKKHGGEGKGLQEAVDTFVNDFREMQSLERLTDTQLAERIDILDAADRRIDQAVDGAGGKVAEGSGAAYDRFDQLQKQKAAAEQKLSDMDKAMEDAMQRGPVFADGYREAREQTLNDIATAEQELQKFAPLSDAESLARGVTAMNDAINDYAKGLPRGPDGKIDEAKLGQQVQVVGQAQMELSRMAGEMEGLEAKGGNLSPKEKARLGALRKATGEMTASLKEMGIDATVADGKVSVEATSLGGAVTWNAARESVAGMVDQINTTKQKVASLQNKPPPKDLMAKPGQAAAPPAQQMAAAVGATHERAKPTPPAQAAPLTPATGAAAVAQEIQGHAAKATAAAAGMVQTAAATGTPRPRPPATAPVGSADMKTLRDKAAQARDDARKKFQAARTAKQDAEAAKEEAAEAARDAEEAGKAADTYGKTRKRQAGEWNELADSSAQRADNMREQAEAIEDKAAKARKAAQRYETVAGQTNDTTLANNARQAAANAREDAAKLESQAADKRREAQKEDAEAKERAAHGNAIAEEVKKLDADAASKEAEAKKKAAEAASRIEAAKTADVAAAKATEVAAEQDQALRAEQQKTFGAMLENPPSSTFWSDMKSGERAQWMRDNVPNWDNLSIDEQVRILRVTDYSEARSQAIDAGNALDRFVKDKNFTEEGLTQRAEEIKTMQRQLAEAKDELLLSAEDQQKIRGLEGKIRVAKGKLAADIKEFDRLRDEAITSSREVARQQWGLDEKAREREVQRRVDRLAEAKGQLKLAEAAAETRDKAFIERMSEERKAMRAATARGDSSAAAKHREAIERLEAAQNEMRTLDASNIRTLEKIVESKRGELVHDSLVDGLYEIGDEDAIERRAEQRMTDKNLVGDALTRQNENIRTAVNAVDVKGDDFSVSGAVLEVYDRTTVRLATDAGMTYGVAKGAVKGLVGLGKLVVWEPIDSIGETAEMGMELVFGARTNFFGTDNQDFVDQVIDDPGSMGMNMVLGLGKEIYDTGQAVVRIGEAQEAKSAGHAFEAATKVGEFIGENFVDPTILIGGVGKLGKLAKVAEVAAETARVADKASDVLRAAERGAEAAADLSKATTKLPPPSTAGTAAELAETVRLPPPATKGTAAELAGTVHMPPPTKGATAAELAETLNLPPPATKGTAAELAGTAHMPPPGTAAIEDLTKTVRIPPPAAAGAGDLAKAAPMPTGTKKLPPPDLPPPGTAGIDDLSKTVELPPPDLPPP